LEPSDYGSHGFEINEDTSFDTQEANKKISGKILKVKVKRVVTVNIEDLPSTSRQSPS